jgi:hypothetical protein
MNYIVWNRADNEVIGGLFDKRSEALEWEAELPMDHEIIEVSLEGSIPKGELDDLHDFVDGNFPTRNSDYYQEALDMLEMFAKATGNEKLTEVVEKLKESFIKVVVSQPRG